MESNTINAIITATATIIAAIISASAAIIAANKAKAGREDAIEIKPKKDELFEPSLHRRSINWWWAVGAASVGGGLAYFIFSMIFHPSIEVANQLLLPANIYIEDSYKGKVEPGSSKTFLVDRYPVEVSFEVVRQTTLGGTAIGDKMVGTWHTVGRGEVVSITPLIGSQYYFFPRVGNNSRSDCEFSINDGWKAENRPKALVERNKTAGLGYYQLFDNSNVTLYCDERIFWWGIRDGEKSGSKSLYEIMQKEDGLIQLVLEK